MLNKLDPKGTAATECQVGAAAAMCIDYYGTIDVPPLVWLSINTALFAGSVAVRRFEATPKASKTKAPNFTGIL